MDRTCCDFKWRCLSLANSSIHYVQIHPSPACTNSHKAFNSLPGNHSKHTDIVYERIQQRQQQQSTNTSPASALRNHTSYFSGDVCSFSSWLKFGKKGVRLEDRVCDLPHSSWYFLPSWHDLDKVWSHCPALGKGKPLTVSWEGHIQIGSHTE